MSQTDQKIDSNLFTNVLLPSEPTPSRRHETRSSKIMLTSGKGGKTVRENRWRQMFRWLCVSLSPSGFTWASFSFFESEISTVRTVWYFQLSYFVPSERRNGIGSGKEGNCEGRKKLSDHMLFLCVQPPVESSRSRGRRENVFSLSVPSVTSGLSNRTHGLFFPFFDFTESRNVSIR